MYSVFSIAIYIFAFLIIYAQLSGIEPLGPKDKKSRISRSVIIFTAVFAFALRVIVAGCLSGHPTDMKCWTYWGSKLYIEKPWNFYSEGFFADYPPGYMYILWLIGSIVGVLKPSNYVILLLYKLPAIIGDLGVAYILFKIAKKHLNEKIAAIIFFFAAFNPLSYFNSVIWGQMDSLLVLFAIMSLYALYEKKYLKSAVLFVVAVLLKPQALMLSPIYLFAFMSTKDIKLIGKTVIICLLAVIAIAFPFSPAHQSGSSAFIRILSSLNPIWLIEKYASTLGSYDYVSVNAFNFPALIGGNWKDINTPFLFLPWKTWGLILIAFAIVFSGVLYFKLKDRAAKIFVPAFFIIAFLYAFGTKMHERYIYPAIFFLLILYIFSKKRAFLCLFAAESSVNLINLDYVLYCANSSNIAPKQAYISIVAILQTAIIVIALYIIYHTYFKKSNAQEKISETTNKTAASGKLVKADLALMAAVTVLYSAIAFTNLGSTKAPQTFTQIRPAAPVTIELEKETFLSRIAYYYGIGSVSPAASLEISYSTDGENWTVSDTSCVLGSVFKWDYADFNKDNAAVKYIRLTSNTSNCSIGEIGIFDEKSKLVKIKSSTAPSAFDEQNIIPAESTYKNGTYFDEIYHPRSAYELLNGLDYYETTHPPLGKILIAVGISVFGMTPFGWRFMGTLFGALMLPVLYIMLKKLFKSTKFAFLGTLLFSIDFMHYALTRMGTIDSYAVFFILVMYLAMYYFIANLKESIDEYKGEFFAKGAKKIYIPLLICGIATGLGVASKWIAVYAAFGLAILFFIELFFAYKQLGKENRVFGKFLGRLLPFCVLCFIIIPFGIYLASYIPVARCQGKGLFAAMWDNQKYMLSYHSNLDATHPYSSKWYQWPVIFRPLLVYCHNCNSVASSVNSHAAITIMGNPLIWWSGIGAFVYGIYCGIKNKDKTVLFIVIGLLSQLLPWVFVSRCTFIYHFFASTVFMIMLIVYSLRELELKNSKFKYASAAFCALCVLSFILFYPVLTGIPVLDGYVDCVLAWFGSWVF